MRILVVHNHFVHSYFSGAEVAVYNFCRKLIGLGHDCLLLVVNNRGPKFVDEFYELDGIPVHRIDLPTVRTPWSDTFDMRIFRIVLKEIQRVKPDIVNVQSLSGSTLAPYAACDWAKVPVIGNLHDHWLLCANNMLYRKDGSLCDPGIGLGRCANCFTRYDFWADIPFRRLVFRWFTRNVKAFVSPSQSLIDLHVRGGYARERFRLIHYGLEPQKPSSETRPAPLDNVFKLTGKKPIVTFLGGGIESKGAQVLLDAMPFVFQNNADVHFVIAGGGEPHYLTSFRRFFPRVLEIGRLPFKDIVSLYAISDLVLAPSVWYDTSPTVIYQSYHWGVPVIGSNLGGIPELIRHGETGYVVPPGNAIALAEQIVKHFSVSSRQRRKMRKNCFLASRTWLAPENEISLVLPLYEKVLGQP